MNGSMAYLLVHAHIKEVKYTKPNDSSYWSLDFVIK